MKPHYALAVFAAASPLLTGYSGEARKAFRASATNTKSGNIEPS